MLSLKRSISMILFLLISGFGISQKVTGLSFSVGLGLNDPDRQAFTGSSIFDVVEKSADPSLGFSVEAMLNLDFNNLRLSGVGGYIFATAGGDRPSFFSFDVLNTFRPALRESYWYGVQVNYRPVFLTNKIMIGGGVFRNYKPSTFIIRYSVDRDPFEDDLFNDFNYFSAHLGIGIQNGPIQTFVRYHFDNDNRRLSTFTISNYFQIDLIGGSGNEEDQRSETTFNGSLAFGYLIPANNALAASSFYELGMTYGLSDDLALRYKFGSTTNRVYGANNDFEILRVNGDIGIQYNDPLLTDMSWHVVSVLPRALSSKSIQTGIGLGYLSQKQNAATGTRTTSSMGVTAHLDHRIYIFTHGLEICWPLGDISAFWTYRLGLTYDF